MILGLTLPDNLATGGASFIVHLANNNSLTGLIDILDFINIETVRLTENNKIIGEPSIVRLKSHNKSLHKIKVHLRGNDFVGRKILLRQGDGSIRFPQNQQGDPNTSITVYPSSLNLQVIKRSVSLNGKVMNIILRAPQEITETKSVVLVIATPRGIVSKGFVISPKVKKQ